jgi:hypothetical protein
VAAGRIAPDTELRDAVLGADVAHGGETLLKRERVEGRGCGIGGRVVQNPGVVASLIEVGGCVGAFVVERNELVTAAGDNKDADAVGVRSGIEAKTRVVQPEELSERFLTIYMPCR